MYLNVYLGGLKAPWVEYCKNLGLKPGAAIKQGIEQQLAKARPKEESKVYAQEKDAPDMGKKVKMEVWLTPSEKKAVMEIAEQSGCSQRTWVIDAVRAGLTRAPHYSMEEMRLLGESNYQLLAIGRTLRQLLERMDGDIYEPETVEAIKELKRLVDQHTTHVADTIAANLERWGIV
jgi:hypothetical protein